MSAAERLLFDVGFWTLLVAIVGSFLVYRRLRRRLVAGVATEVERRHQRTLERFQVEVDRFKFARQGSVKTLLNHDHAIWTEVDMLASKGQDSRSRMRMRVHTYVEEIVPFFRPLAYWGIGARLARWVLNGLYRIDFDEAAVEKLRGLAKEKPRSLVYLLNHRSNVDYVLAAYVLREKLALSFAVGEWARVWPLEYLFKSFGSYFLRRGFRDPLYHTVLRRYVQLVTKNGVTQALFPEGGLSRDGRLRPPKIGLLDAIICAKEDRSFARELVFVPAAINYDRVLEDRALVGELAAGEVQDATPTSGKKVRVRRSRFAMLGHVWRILFGNVRLFASRALRKNGYALVRFGEPVSFDDWHTAQGVDIFSLSKEERRTYVAKFCNEMMARIAAVVPATPLCVVAKALVDHTPKDRPSLVRAVESTISGLEDKGVVIFGKERGIDWMIDGALMRFSLRHFVRVDGETLNLDPEVLPLLRYYADSLAHYVDGEVPTVEKPKHLEGGAAPAVLPEPAKA